MKGIELPVIEAIVRELREGNASVASEAASMALRENPQHPGLLALHGISQFQLGNLDVAEGRLKEALQRGPATPAIYYHLALLAEKRELVEVAKQYYEEVLTLDKSHYPALLNLGNCLFKSGLYLDAKKCFDKALAMSSDQRIHKNLGVIGLETNELQVAEYHFRLALVAAPDWHEAELNLAFSLLKQQRYEEGWSLYESRLKADSQRQMNAPALPRWDYRPDQKILIWTEQGVGDAIMFLSLLPEIMARSSEVGVLTDERLHSLIRRSFGAHIDLFDSAVHPEILSRYEFQASIESCPQFFRSSQDDFNGRRAPYIEADPKLKDQLAAELENQARGRLKLGVSWRTVNAETGERRTIPLESLLAVLPSDDCLLINLQYGSNDTDLQQCRAKGFSIDHPMGIDFIRDLDGFAATVAACDYVLTIDNSTAHFAGAIGVPQTVLLPYVCDWRWGNSSNAIWYENCHLVRQATRGDWSGPLNKVSTAIEALAKARDGSQSKLY